jgi:hypothetical protein
VPLRAASTDYSRFVHVRAAQAVKGFTLASAITKIQEAKFGKIVAEADIPRFEARCVHPLCLC